MTMRILSVEAPVGWSVATYHSTATETMAIRRGVR